MEKWITGMDLSTLLEVERCGGKFFEKSVCRDAMDILKDHGMNMVRLRLWNDPFDEDGNSYGAGWQSARRKRESAGCWISITAISGRTPESRSRRRRGRA